MTPLDTPAHDDTAPRRRLPMLWFLALSLTASTIGCGRSAEADAPSRASPGRAHPVELVLPPSHGVLDTAQRTVRGARAGIACATCHAAGVAPAFASRRGEPAAGHDPAMLRHGKLTCKSCHAAEDPGQLALADGTRLPMADSITLCGQCHGPQLRDFEHGAHGGMRGYWDTSRGPRERNHCTSCHPAHEPAYPAVVPAPPPRDRFVTPKRHPSSATSRWETHDHE